MGKNTYAEERNNEDYNDGYKHGRSSDDPLMYVVDCLLMGDSPYDKGIRQGREDKAKYGKK